MRGTAGELARFGGAATINTLFGYGTYAVLVAAGLHPLVAQLLAQVAGVIFNARTYALAFRKPAARGRFLLSYAANYLVGLGLLATLTHLLSDPYLAGALTMAGAALFNFVALRSFVFRHPVLAA